MQQGQSEPYTWKSVQMVGGGFVDGIVFHPAKKGLAYARTDIGGAYRRDSEHGTWTPLLDWLSLKDVNMMGVEGIALDPHDSKKVYLACGMYTNSTSPKAVVLRSDDRGHTFSRSDLPFKLGGNEDGRGNGERIAVDPNDGKILFCGSRHDGLWRSSDGAKTWQKVDSFPFPKGVDRSPGIVSILFDPSSARKHHATPRIYVGLSNTTLSGVFATEDAGKTWSRVAGQPEGLRPLRMAMGNHGTVYVAMGSSPGPSRMTKGGIFSFQPLTKAWSDITPEKPTAEKAFGYACVSVDPGDRKTLVASSFYRPGGEQIYRSRDEGKTWMPVIGGKESYDHSGAPYNVHVGIHWLFDTEIDPFNPNHLLFTTGYGGHETFNLEDADKGKPVKWSPFAHGIEETVALELASPRDGSHLITAIGDYGGFVHWDLDRPAPEGNFDHPHFGNTTGVAVAELKPNIIVRVGRASGQGSVNIGYSTDFGKTWQPPPTFPAPRAASGRVSVSADGSVWVWILRAGAFRTQDMGVTWQPISTLPAGFNIVASRINPNEFYALDLFGGQLYVSQDGAKTFTAKAFTLNAGLPKKTDSRFDPRGGQDQLYSTPGIAGDIWIAAFDGLHHSTDDGGAFKTLPHVTEINAFGFGKHAPGQDYPALFLCGVVDSVRGVFRSDDGGASWIRINDDQHQWGLVLQVSGDPRVFGRVYVGTHGRGVLYGDIESSDYKKTDR